MLRKYAHTKAIKNYKGKMAALPYIFIISICLVYINELARFDEIPSTTLQDIQETKRYGRTQGRTAGRSDVRTFG